MTTTTPVCIFDTTLRDGEQTPGVHLSPDAKCRLATSLESLGVDVIEAGFPVSSPGDFAGVRAVAEVLRRCSVAALARALPRDIDAAAEALQPAYRPRIHVFIGTSPIHRERKLHMSPQTVLEHAVAAVRHARRHVADVQFSAEDAYRTEPGFLRQVVTAVIDAGASTVNLPDTVGIALPAAMAAWMADLRSQVPNASRAVFSAHCHNDLGMATANTLEAVRGGARQVEVTMNGLGERAGNAALEEVVMALQLHGATLGGVRTGIDTRQLYAMSRQVAEMTGIAPPPNKAVVGRNAFAHEAGIHQDGVLKDPATYEILQPGEVGQSGSALVLGKHSGRNAFRARLGALGIVVNETAQMEAMFTEFKRCADAEGPMNDEDLRAVAVRAGWRASV
ncbi:MAG: 2-isopropylmalate synthase [Magnetococcus sp. WYHC-3]